MTPDAVGVTYISKAAAAAEVTYVSPGAPGAVTVTHVSPGAARVT